MGLIHQLMSLLFGSQRNAIVETVEVFRENAESSAERTARFQEAALAQYASEFTQPRAGAFDRLMDGLNRVPRPALALGTLGLFISAMIHPIWFASRMQGIALVPEPLWWLLGAIVSFYFGARHQTKNQEFQRSIASTVALASRVNSNLAALQALDAGAGQAAGSGADAETALRAMAPGPNPALEAWRMEPGK